MSILPKVPNQGIEWQDDLSPERWRTKLIQSLSHHQETQQAVRAWLARLLKSNSPHRSYVWHYDFVLVWASGSSEIISSVPAPVLLVYFTVRGRCRFQKEEAIFPIRSSCIMMTRFTDPECNPDKSWYMYSSVPLRSLISAKRDEEKWPKGTVTARYAFEPAHQRPQPPSI